MPELQEIGLDPAVQGVPVKKKLSVYLARIDGSRKNQLKRSIYMGEDLFTIDDVIFLMTSSLENKFLLRRSHVTD